MVEHEEYMTCPECDGAGEMNTLACRRCFGMGKVPFLVYSSEDELDMIENDIKESAEERRNED